jgi:long-subunit acyl-CoA synthetase (AMP-forming)
MFNKPTANLSNTVTISETPKMVKAQSFLEIFYEREKLHPDKVYLRQPTSKQWDEYTWAEVGSQARKILTALRDMGLEKGDHVGLLSKNCYEWFIADLAILMGGFVSVPFYPTLPADDLKEVIKLSHIKALFVGKLEHWDEQKSGIPKEIKCISFPHYRKNSLVKCEFEWQKLLQNYEPASDVHLPKKDELFTIIYTSGTTGTPKGVMLTYDCANQVMLHEREKPTYGIYQGVSERVVSYLPLNHIAERIISEISSIVAGSEVSFSESLDHFAKNLQSVQPTQFFAVPRIWTKIQQGILGKLAQKKLNILLRLPFINGVLKNKIREGLGLRDVRSAISGAAPISAAVLRWFSKLDIQIQEVYGATELCGGVTYNAVNDISPGTVGKPLHGTEVRIDAETDEVLIKAPWVMTGYYNDPKKSAEVLANGFYKTGDTGRLDAQGNLVITGRIKDTFKTAKGKFILPVPIEQKLGRNFHIEQVMVTGFGLVQPIALVNLSENSAELSDSEIVESLLETLNEVNRELESYTRISHLIIFREAWAEDSGYFTPTLKLKRHIVDIAYKENYEKWAESSETISWCEV